MGIHYIWLKDLFIFILAHQDKREEMSKILFTLNHKLLNDVLTPLQVISRPS